MCVTIVSTSWLPTAMMEVAHVNTEESFNGSYAFQWNSHSLGVHLFNEEKPNGVDLLAPFNITRNIQVKKNIFRSAPSIGVFVN